MRFKMFSGQRNLDHLSTEIVSTLISFFKLPASDSPLGLWYLAIAGSWNRMIRRGSACYRNTHFNRNFNRQDYWSTGLRSPPRDDEQNLMLIGATESGEYTSVAFERYAMTGDNSKDVQFGVRYRK